MATIDQMLAELAAAELACREHTRETIRIEDMYGKDSPEDEAHYTAWPALYDRLARAQKALANYAIDWAAERARSFVTAANEVGT